MSWRVAESLLKLREQVNEAAPGRSKKSDGAIGDERHQASKSSDHNPHIKDDKTGVVTAIDITDDLVNGCDAGRLAAALIASQDHRVKYVIFNRKMASSYPAHGHAAWTWRPYSGANPHTKHVHISVVADKVLYDNRGDWEIGDVDGD